MRNGKLNGLDERLQRLENEVRHLRALLETHVQPKGWHAFVGTHEGDPVFDEIVRLGRKYRESLRPRRVRKKSKVIVG